MNKENSKIVKLQNEQKRLKFWRRKGEWFLAGACLMFVSMIPVVKVLSLGSISALITSIGFVASLSAFMGHELFAKEKMLKRIHSIDQEILQIFKQDEHEKELFIAHEREERKTKENKTEKRLIEDMINSEKFNVEEFEEESQISLTIEECENEEYKLIINEDHLINQDENNIL